MSSLRYPDFHYLRRKLSMAPASYKRTLDVWEARGGQFSYKASDLKQIAHTDDFYKYVDYSPAGRKRIYIGQICPHSENSVIKQGMGIRVYEDGEFEEGYWFNNKQHQRGR